MVIVFALHIPDLAPNTRYIPTASILSSHRPSPDARSLDSRTSMATLPTAWLAPPDNHSSADYNTGITPTPLAISVALAVAVGIVVIILFFRKDKDVFLEDRFPDVAEAKTATAIADNIHRSLPPMRNARSIQRPPPIHAKRIRRQPSFGLEPKLDKMLEFKNLNWDSEHPMQTPQLPLAHQYDFMSLHIDDRSDVDTLHDDEKNSAYVPYPSSEASDDTYRYGKGRSRRVHDLQVLDDASVSWGSQLSFGSRSNLGDAY
jgi:hypothetical protein